MKKNIPYHLEVEIDRLTNSVQNTISGDSFATDVFEIARADLKTVTKTKLIEHYELSLGATHVGGHKMVIFPVAALKLIKQYYQT